MDRYLSSAIERLKIDEGLRLTVYKCPAGKFTIGFGRNVEEKGISTKEAEFLLNNDVIEVDKKLNEDFVFYKDLSENRKIVLISMAFQLGLGGLKKFKKFISALFIKDYQTAAFEMKNSSWYNQTTQRAQRLINLMMEG